MLLNSYSGLVGLCFLLFGSTRWNDFIELRFGVGGEIFIKRVINSVLMILNSFRVHVLSGLSTMGSTHGYSHDSPSANIYMLYLFFLKIKVCLWSGEHCDLCPVIWQHAMQLLCLIYLSSFFIISLASISILENTKRYTVEYLFVLKRSQFATTPT